MNIFLIGRAKISQSGCFGCLFAFCVATFSVATACTAPPAALPVEAARVALQSQCAQNVIECTTAWPVAVVGVVAGPGQDVLETDAGFLIRGIGDDGIEAVRLTGSESAVGNGAT